MSGSRGAAFVVSSLAASAAALLVGLSIVGAAGQGEAASSVATVSAFAALECPLSGPLKGFGADEAANAERVVAAAMAVSHEDRRAARIALMAALADSHLQNLDHGEDGRFGIFRLPARGWGTPAQLREPTYETAAFVRRLLALARWRSLAPWGVAQELVLAPPGHESRYRHDWAAAGAILARVIAAGEAPGRCGQGIGRPDGAGYGLPPGYVVPSGTPPSHAAVVRFALAQLGKPYLWGGAGPAAYDCSGLTMAAWASVGVTLAHAASVQELAGAAVTAAQLVPGDLVLVPGTDSPGPGLAGHVGIYLGYGLVGSAIDTRYGIAVQSWTTFVSGGLIALRDPDPGA